jgi:hypothetical protein
MVDNGDVHVSQEKASRRRKSKVIPTPIFHPPQRFNLPYLGIGRTHLAKSHVLTPEPSNRRKQMTILSWSMPVVPQKISAG